MTSKQIQIAVFLFTCLCCWTLLRIVDHHNNSYKEKNTQQQQENMNDEGVFSVLSHLTFKNKLFKDSIQDIGASETEHITLEKEQLHADSNHARDILLRADTTFHMNKTNNQLQEPTQIRSSRTKQTLTSLGPRHTIFLYADPKAIEKYKMNLNSFRCYVRQQKDYSLQIISTEDTLFHENCKRDNLMFTRHCVLANFMAQNPDISSVMFLDADCAVLDFSRRFETFLGNEKDVSFEIRFHNGEISAGNYIIRNTEFSRIFLREWANTKFQYNADNGALHQYLLKRVGLENACSKSKTYEMFLHCFHAEVSKLCNDTLWTKHVSVWHPMHSFTYDGWLTKYKYGPNTFIHHANKNPPITKGKNGRIFPDVMSNNCRMPENDPYRITRQEELILMQEEFEKRTEMWKKISGLSPNSCLLTVGSQPRSSTRVKICVCALTRSKPTWKTLDDSRVMKNVIASTHRTTAMEWDKFEVQILLGADADDAFWQRHADALKRQAVDKYKLHVAFKFYVKHANFLPFNDLMRDGYHTGSEYLVRINDDTEFTSKGWMSLGVKTLKGFQPPNVGVVGPSCAQGNTKILTHDMVHRTHLNIFKTYYPPVFHNWYLDDWISLVYGPARTKKIKNWTVFHHVEQQGQRYAAVTSDSRSLQVEVEAGGNVISRYLKTLHSKVTETRKYPAQYIAYSWHGNNTRFTNYITNKTLHAITSSARTDSLQQLVTKAREIHRSHGFVNIQFLNAGYVEMTKSWICNVRSFKNVLNATLFLTTDHKAFDQLHRFDTNLNLVRILYSAPKNMAYGQYSYRKYMLFRANTIVKLLQENVTVWLTESDAVWFKDPTDLVQNSAGDFVTMSDGLPPEKLLQGGFLFLRPTPRTLALWTRMRAEIKAKIETVQIGMDMGGFGSDQLTLNTIIKKEKNLDIHWLDPQKFVPGLYYKNPKAYVLPVVVLNNWIIGNQAKKERAQKWGHWFLQQDGKCHATSKDVRILETAGKQHRISLFTTRLTVPECIHSKTFTEKSTRKMICLDKIVPHACTVYSFGINYQWEFDDFMHAYGCVVRSFDPGMQYQRQRGARHFFEAVGIGAQSGLHQGESTLYSKKKTYSVETLESIMQRHGDTFVDVVRLDVESAEFDVLDTLPYDQIGQLSLEIHMWKHTLKQWTLKLQAVELRHVQTFQNTDRVNPRTMTEIAPGITRVYELTFINTQQQKRVHVPAHAADTTSVDAVIVSNYVNCVTRAVVDGLCSHLQKIGRVHVIVPASALLACTELPNVTCHDENTILNPESSWVYGQNRLGWTAAGSRRAWYYQQMLKLFAFQRIELSPQFVLWDADNVLVQPYSPFLHQSLRFLTAGDGMPERGQYIPTTRALVGNVETRTDVVVHQMPVDSVMLQELLMHVCGARTHEACAKHIMDSIPPAAHPALGFSEYHLFYTWVSSRYRSRVLLDSDKKLTRTGKKAWTSDSCMRALAATHAPNVFMLVLEQKADYVIRKRSASGPAGATVQAWGGASAHPSSGPKHCRWVTFQNTYQMCVHEHMDTVSDTIARTGRWPDCDILHTLWQKRPLASADDMYVEIGGNIGSCVLHMLLHTDARMIVFEPNPDNLFCMTSTLLRLPVHMQIRVTLYPVALGDKASLSKLFVSSTNAGNGIVNHKIGREHEAFNAPIEIQVRRYDALFSAKDRVGLLKMDAQGHECAIVRGMGTQLSHIQVLKTEISNLWLSGHENCSDSILFHLFHAHGRRVTDQHGVTMKAPGAADVYDVVVW